MSSQPLTRPTPTRSRDAAGSVDRSVTRERGREEPETILERIRSLLTDHSLEARRLAAAAAVQFPEHAGLRNADRVLNSGRVKVGSGSPEPATKAEFSWLRNPPESAHGKWVALVGEDMVGRADTLGDLVDSLRLRKLAKPALVHRID